MGAGQQLGIRQEAVQGVGMGVDRGGAGRGGADLGGAGPVELGWAI